MCLTVTLTASIRGLHHHAFLFARSHPYSLPSLRLLLLLLLTPSPPSSSSSSSFSSLAPYSCSALITSSSQASARGVSLSYGCIDTLVALLLSEIPYLFHVTNVTTVLNVTVASDRVSRWVSRLLLPCSRCLDHVSFLPKSPVYIQWHSREYRYPMCVQTNTLVALLLLPFLHWLDQVSCLQKSPVCTQWHSVI